MKQKRYRFALYMMVMACFTACTSNTTTKNDRNLVEKNTIQNSTITEKQLNDLLVGYLEIKDALVNSDEKAAAFAAENLQHTIGKTNDKMIIQLMESVQLIENVEDVEEQRVYFEDLSTNMYSLVSQKELNRLTLYQQFCPMAFDDAGAFWLSAEKEVYNPYFGDKMLRCGKVTETLD